MSLAELRSATTKAWRSAARTLRTTPITNRLNNHGWSPEEAERLAAYFDELEGQLDGVRPMDSISLAKWFASVGITPFAEDDMKLACYMAEEYWNAYVFRVT